MLVDEALKYYLENDYNCSECIVRAGNDYYNLGLHDHDMKMVAAFGKGMQICDTCGALTGALCLISSKYVETRAHDTKDLPKIVIKMTQAFTNGFKTKICADIRKDYFNPETRCLKTIEKSCDIIEKVISDYDKSISE